MSGTLYDLSRPLEKDCCVELLDFENDEGRAVFWHSSAHVLGEACEKHFACLICFGPPTEEGFHYDIKNPEDKKILFEQYKLITESLNKINEIREPANTWAHVRPKIPESALKAFIIVDLERSDLLDAIQKVDLKEKIQKHRPKILEEIRKTKIIETENAKKRQEIRRET